MGITESYIILIIVLLAIIIIVYIYFYTIQQQQKILLDYSDGIYSNIKTDLCVSSPNIKCSGNNPLTPYGALYFKGSLDMDILSADVVGAGVGARPIRNNEAIVLYGKIPVGYLYWGITGYLYSLNINDTSYVIAGSLGDSISSGEVISNNSDNSMVVIMTANPKLYEMVKESIINEFYDSNNYQFFPIYIPEYMNVEGGYYNLMTRVTLRDPNEAIPTYKCRLYNSSNIGYHTIKDVPLKPRSLVPREQDIVSQENWDIFSDKIIVEKGYNIVRKIKVNYFLEKLYPGGVNYGYQCLDSLINCKFDNRDCTYFISDYITVFPGEKVAVVCVDHANSGRAIYSNISFYNSTKEYGYSSYISGDLYAHPDINTNNLVTHVIINNPMAENLNDNADDITLLHSQKMGMTVNIIERAYLQPNTMVGPATNSLLKMSVYIVSNTENTHTLPPLLAL